jgi:hypothetical protein
MFTLEDGTLFDHAHLLKIIELQLLILQAVASELKPGIAHVPRLGFPEYN